MFKFFMENDLISSNQSGFTPEDSFINQQLSIAHEICKSFDFSYVTRGVFFDMLKKNLTLGSATTGVSQGLILSPFFPHLF